MNVLLMADKYVGSEIVDWVFRYYKSDISCLVTTKKDDLYFKYISLIDNVFFFENSEKLITDIKNTKIEIDYGVLAWWPYIISCEIISLAKNSFINTHPSLLPYNKGKNYNFWTLVEQVPFGVTLHLVEKSIDSGDIIAQKNIPYTWEDNGGTLYNKATSEMIDLFKNTYPYIRAGTFIRKKQDINLGSFHLASELDQASVIDLEKTYKARDLLNLLRARTFPGYPGCWFEDNNIRYEIKIEITKKDIS